MSEEFELETPRTVLLQHDQLVLNRGGGEGEGRSLIKLGRGRKIFGLLYKFIQ